MQLYKDNNLTIKYAKESSTLLMTWSGYTNDDTYCNLIDLINKLMVANKVKRTLHDVREHKGITPKSQDYAAELSLEFRQKHWQMDKRAMVIKPDHDVFSKYGVQRFVKKVEDIDYEGQRREFFDDVEEAYAWIMG
ncbi:hypothetical protein [Microscilla marina]|uniref:STAS/SEC14 domain-containing protein n=1 Tax=Microscilla marina ATCC 23134 TaxID=313606 RepID=A1ZCG7_MICM2|nr:hypothetical protein [Microscilla marina]EAY31969.1 hypothetical protein M23134_01998 [Microscilla marina ATCC 23134]